jgi:hypothetical protein
MRQKAEVLEILAGCGREGAGLNLKTIIFHWFSPCYKASGGSPGEERARRADHNADRKAFENMRLCIDDTISQAKDLADTVLVQTAPYIAKLLKI